MEQEIKYKQLSYEERVKIETLNSSGGSVRSIARVLQRSPNTVARELREKKVEGSYLSKKAQHKTYWRRYRAKRNCLKVAMNQELDRLVREKLALGWSPERIAGRAKMANLLVSKKAIYKFVRSRCLERYLFWSKHKKKRCSKRGIFSAKDSLKRSVALRPAVLGSGHLELDFIVSRQSAVALMVVVDRYTRHTAVRKLKRKTHPAVLGALREICQHCLIKTITTDNDIVFRKWRDLEMAVAVPFFFTQPYHSWEKGLVENTNRWIRTFVPKKRDIATVSDDEIRSIEFHLNETPRQILGYRTAAEVLLANQMS